MSKTNHFELLVTDNSESLSDDDKSSDNWDYVKKNKNGKPHRFYSYKKEENKKTCNFKKILCKNMIEKGSCDYSGKCVYAHSLDEQNLEPIRKNALDILDSETDLSEYDRIKDKELYKTFADMTRICENCVNNKCTGGKNCKHGIKDKTKLICDYDLKFGNCSLSDCKKIHLSLRGLQPMIQQKREFNQSERYIGKYYRDKLYIDSDQDTLSGSFFRSPYIGKLLNDNYVNLLSTLDKVGKISNNDNSNEHNDEDNLSFISDISDTECEKSIFMDDIDDKINKIEN